MFCSFIPKFALTVAPVCVSAPIDSKNVLVVTLPAKVELLPVITKGVYVPPLVVDVLNVIEDSLPVFAG